MRHDAGIGPQTYLSPIGPLHGYSGDWPDADFIFPQIPLWLPTMIYGE